MCNEFHIEGHGYVRKVGQLAAAIGGRDKVIVSAGYPSLPDDCCLCPVDLDATFEANGYQHEWDEGVCWVRPA